MKARSLALLAVCRRRPGARRLRRPSDDTAGAARPAASAPPSGGTKAQLSLVAYSTPQVVYDEVIPGFQKTEAGKGVAFKTSFGASGDQSRAVEAGLPADVVSFSLEPDMTASSRPASSPTTGPTRRRRASSRSPWSVIVRKGNPKNIHTWDDLLKPGVKVLTPNPFTSGAAKWNILAAYGARAAAGERRRASTTCAS